MINPFSIFTNKRKNTEAVIQALRAENVMLRKRLDRVREQRDYHSARINKMRQLLFGAVDEGGSK